MQLGSRSSEVLLVGGTVPQSVPRAAEEHPFREEAEWHGVPSPDRQNPLLQATSPHHRTWSPAATSPGPGHKVPGHPWTQKTSQLDTSDSTGSLQAWRVALEWQILLSNEHMAGAPTHHMERNSSCPAELWKGWEKRVNWWQQQNHRIKSATWKRLTQQSHQNKWHLT